MSYENFRKELFQIDGSSSPGWPYMQVATTNAQWLGADGLGNYDEQRVALLWHDVTRVLSGTFEHRFRAFVKDEPHKKNKILAGKWRLIFASALPVQMVWRMAFSHQNKWLNANPYTTPSAHGLVFPFGGWRRFKAHLDSKGLVWSRDISAWDVNAPGWVMELVKRLRISWGGPSSWIRVVNMLYEDAFSNARLQFSNGIVLQQVFKGFQKSGLYNTISDNSLGMFLGHVVSSYRAQLPVGAMWATGDDVLQSHISDAYLDRLGELGFKVKEYVKAPVFMGTDFTGPPVPVYFEKHVVNFCTTTADKADVLESYLRLYAYSELSEFWEQVGIELGLKVRSRTYCQFWYGSPLARLFYSDCL